MTIAYQYACPHATVHVPSLMNSIIMACHDNMDTLRVEGRGSGHNKATADEQHGQLTKELLCNLVLRTSQLLL